MKKIYLIRHAQSEANAGQQAKPSKNAVNAGKGHETYQEIKGVRYDFDDKVVVKNAIDKFGK